MNEFIGFKKVKDEYGWMGNMSPHPVEYDGKVWKTCEALFQSLRFDNDMIKEIIRSEKSPMGAKMKSKSFRNNRVVKEMSKEDVENMRMVVKLKFDNYEWIRKELKKLKGMIIYENVDKRKGGRNSFWGGYVVNGVLIGDNVMGKIWMELMEGIK